MDARFAESLVNSQHVVLGRKLHDYCLYDLLFLDLDQSPLLYKHRDVTREDLHAAVLICSTPPKYLLQGRRGPGPKLWQRLLTMRWTRKVKSMSVSIELRKFNTYVEDFDARPKFWESTEEGDAGSLRAPWVLSVATFLEDHTNMTEHEIMTAPVGRMMWKSAALAEQLGLTRSDIMTQDEEAAMKEMGIEV